MNGHHLYPEHFQRLPSVQSHVLGPRLSPVQMSSPRPPAYSPTTLLDDKARSFEEGWYNDLKFIEQRFDDADRKAANALKLDKQAVEERTRRRLVQLEHPRVKHYRTFLPQLFDELVELLTERRSMLIRDLVRTHKEGQKERDKARNNELVSHVDRRRLWWLDIRKKHTATPQPGRPMPAPAARPATPSRTYRQPKYRGHQSLASPSEDRDEALSGPVKLPNGGRSGPQSDHAAVAASSGSPALSSLHPRIWLNDAQKKRRLENDGDAPDAAIKKPRLSESESATPPTRFSTPLAGITRSVTFKDIYQDGDPEHKHFIIKFSPNEEEAGFYILKCEPHGVHFGLSPIQGGAKHLHSQAHNHMPKYHQVAVEQLGYHVTDCTQELADMNNEMVRKAYDAGYQPFNRKNLTRTGTGTIMPGDEALMLAANMHGVSRPEAGHLYYAESSSTEIPGQTHKYPVMILNWASQDSCGFRGETLTSLGLMNTGSPLPQCYVFDAEGKNIIRWAEGYENGGPYENLRQFPVAWFADPQFFSYSWVEARWLSEFNLDNSSDQPDRDDQNNLRQKARNHFAQARGFATFKRLKEEKSIEELRPSASRLKIKMGRRYSVEPDSSSLSSIEDQRLELLRERPITPTLPKKQQHSAAALPTSTSPSHTSASLAATKGTPRIEDRPTLGRHSVNSDGPESRSQFPRNVDTSARSTSLPLPIGLRPASPPNGAGVSLRTPGLQVVRRAESDVSPLFLGSGTTKETIEVAASRRTATDLTSNRKPPIFSDPARHALLAGPPPPYGSSNATTVSGQKQPQQQQQQQALSLELRDPPVPPATRVDKGTSQPLSQARAGPLARVPAEGSVSAASSPLVPSGGFGGAPKTFDLVAFSDGRCKWERGGAQGELLKLAMVTKDSGSVVAQSMAGAPVDVSIQPSQVVRLGSIVSNSDQTESSLVVGLKDREMKLTFGVTKFLRSEVQARSLFKWIMQNLGDKSVAFTSGS